MILNVLSIGQKFNRRDGVVVTCIGMVSFDNPQDGFIFCDDVLRGKSGSCLDGYKWLDVTGPKK